MPRRSKTERTYRRKMIVASVSLIVCAFAINLTVSLVPAVGLIQRELYLALGSAVLVLAGWLLGLNAEA